MTKTASHATLTAAEVTAEPTDEKRWLPMLRLPAFCPLREAKGDEFKLCPRSETEGGCRQCMTEHVDEGTDP